MGEVSCLYQKQTFGFSFEGRGSYNYFMVLAVNHFVNQERREDGRRHSKRDNYRLLLDYSCEWCDWLSGRVPFLVIMKRVSGEQNIVETKSIGSNFQIKVVPASLSKPQMKISQGVNVQLSQIQDPNKYMFQQNKCSMLLCVLLVALTVEQWLFSY